MASGRIRMLRGIHFMILGRIFVLVGLGSSGVLHDLDMGNILMACGFIGCVNGELSAINVNFPGAVGDKIGLADKVIIESMKFVDGSVMLMPNLYAQLRAGKEAEGQLFVNFVSFF